MSVGPEDIHKIAHLARLKIEEDKIIKISEDISNILSLVEQLQMTDTNNIEPMAHPMDATQTLRTDKVSEVDNRDKLQAVAPNTKDGLFLVPKVIE
mgnify:CR=1 FL=1